MKKCPFCAEDIREEAIKCRYCGSFLSAAPPAAASQPAATPASPARKAAEEPAAAAPAEEAAAAAPADEPVAAPRSRSGQMRREPALAPAVSSRSRDHRASEGWADDPLARERTRKVLYAGHPSWRAYLLEYTLVSLATLLVPAIASWVGAALEASLLTRVLLAGIPLAVGAVAFLSVTIYRKSKVFRVSTSNIESEYGVLSKKIDVLELWRCRDVRYRQSLLDRILGIAHIEIFTADVTTPQLEICGVPASRELFERIRDSIEIQRQSRNVYGVIH